MTLTGRHRRKLRSTGQSLGGRLNNLLARFSMLSEASAANYEVSVKGGDEQIGPPGAFTQQRSSHEEIHEITTRFVDWVEYELDRHKRGPQIGGAMTELDRDELIVKLLRGGMPSNAIAFITGVDESIVNSFTRREAA